MGKDLLMLPSVSAVVLNEAGEILLGKRSDNGKWSLLAGTVDPGEQPADATLREIQEESGVEAVIERLVGVALHPVTYPDGNQCEYLNVWFRCRAIGGAARVNDDESTAMQWFPPDGLPELEPWEQLRIDTALSDAPAAWYAQPGSHHEELTSPEVM